MTFIRREFQVWIQQAGRSGGRGAEIYPDHISVTYRINDIPSAVFSVTFGRTLDGSISEAAVNRSIERLYGWSENRNELQLMVNVNELDVGTGKSKQITRELFRGYIFAPSLELMRRSAACRLQMHHWLVDLSAGSMLAHYGSMSAQDTTKAALLYAGSPGAGGGQLSSSSNSTETITYRLMLPSGFEKAIMQDLWGNGQKAILASAASLGGSVNLNNNKRIHCVDYVNRVPETVRIALQRIQGPLSGLAGGADRLGRPYDQSGGPVRFRASLGSDVGYRIGLELGGRKLNDLAGISYWDKLIHFCAEYGLMLIPRSQDAMVRPVNLAGLAPSSPDIKEDSYEQFSWLAFQQNALRGVGVEIPNNNTMGELSTLSQSPIRVVETGCYIDQQASQGLVQFTQSPRWLSIMPAGETNLISVNQLWSASNGVMNPSGQSPKKPDGPDSISGILDAYAKMVYLQQTLANRTVNLAGPIRFDLMPGSLVKVGVDPSRMVSRLNIPTQNLTGIVKACTFTIDRKQRIGSTVFGLDYCRTDRQANDQNLTQAEHPVFESLSRLIPLP
jgi:hypothetical protein